MKKFINNLPIVSVIITTKNEEGNIQKCIESINKQTYPSLNIEIIVIDNYSTDKTIQIVKHLTNKLKNLSIKLYSHGNERSAQRNYGAEKAHGKYYLYLDADMILSPNVIKECVLNIKNLHGLYIPEIIQGDSFWNKVRKFERTFYDKTVIDCVRFLPLSILKRVGGFDESLIGPEDWDFDKKIRHSGQVDIIKNPLYHNEENFNLLKYLNKKNYYGKSFQKYIKKWGKNDPDVRKQFSPAYRFVWVFLEKGKWKKLLRHPFLAFSMYFLRIVVGLQFILSSNKE